MTEMTAVERCETVLAGGIPDRVPVELHDFMVAAPALYREIAWPHERNVTQRLLKDGVRIQNHICGNATAIVPDMVETGAVILGLDYKCDLSSIKEATRGRATIVGTIDPSEIVARGTPDDVTEAAREELAILAPGGGLILGAGCAIPPGTPDENLRTLIEAGRTFGRYDGDLPALRPLAGLSLQSRPISSRVGGSAPGRVQLMAAAWTANVTAASSRSTSPSSRRPKPCSSQ